jgi:hypothetical protein
MRGVRRAVALIGSGVLVFLGLGAAAGSARLDEAAAASTAVSALASTVTFTSTQVGLSGTTTQFSESGHWKMAWSFDCTPNIVPPSPGGFEVTVNQPAGDHFSDPGPSAEAYPGNTGTSYYGDTGTFSLKVFSKCTWIITVSPDTSTPAHDTATFTNQQDWFAAETSQTSWFSESRSWQITWHMSDCNNLFLPHPYSGLTIYGLSGWSESIPLDFPSPSMEVTDIGTFMLSVDAYCLWPRLLTVTATGLLAPRGRWPPAGTPPPWGTEWPARWPSPPTRPGTATG